MFLTYVYNFKSMFLTLLKPDYFCMLFAMSYLKIFTYYRMLNHSSFNSFACSYICKCLDCFLKAHNKKLNQYCLHFIIFFTARKKNFKNCFGFRLGWVDLQKTWVRSWVNLFLLQVKKSSLSQVFFGSSWVESENSDPFCLV